ncbi:hypothetical protein FALB51S_03343 [Frigidibacter albus]
MENKLCSTTALPAGVFDGGSPRGGKRISASSVRDLCAGISDMTLWRWLNDPELAFPKPIYIGKRRYWKESEILGWLEAQAEASRGAA